MPSQDESPIREDAEVTASSDQTLTEEHKSSGCEPAKGKIISCIQCRKRKLKCDRTKPVCGSCVRRQQQCVFPEGRVKSRVKRRNVKDLEERLAQVETLLGNKVSSEAASNAFSTMDQHPGMGDGDCWDELAMDMDFEDEEDGVGDASSAMPFFDSFGINQSFSGQMIGLGLQEPLPSQDVIDELHQIYFNSIHLSSPLIHKYRYLATANLFPPLGPSICLRYAIWALAASTSDKFLNLQEVFYQRARKYAEADEMKDSGEHFITISHVQCWLLISNYEAQNMYMSRAWVSAGRCIRLAQMMNLHRLDGGIEEVNRIIAPPRDWMDLEERRRTFWTAFCCDRYSCAGTGWPMSIDERDISTNLPCSEDAFENGRIETTLSLAEAMTAQGAAQISPFGGVVLMACLFGHNWMHLHRPGPNNHPEDVLEGEFWKQHRRMDNVLLNTFMFLPQHLRLPHGIRDPNVVYVNMNIHASTICLHQAAIMKAERHNLDPKIIQQSQARCRVAAEEIVNIMRLISQLSLPEMNTWTAFNLYVATGVLIEGCLVKETSQESRSNLEFLLTALQAIGKKHVVTQSFMQQLAIDLEVAGITTSFGSTENANAALLSISRAFPKSVKTTDPRGLRFPSNGLRASMYPRRQSDSVRGESLSSGTSSSDSPKPQLEDQNRSLLQGVLPRNGLIQRLRRPVEAQEISEFSKTADFSFQPNNDGGRNDTNVVKEPLNMPQFGRNYSAQASEEEGQEKRNINKIIHQNSIFKKPQDNDRTTSAFSPQLAHRQQQENPTSSRGIAPNSMNASYLAASKDNFPPDWAFNSLDDAAPGELTGLEFVQQGEDLTPFMNGANWEESMFQS